jgi:hypothetical protein
VKPGALVRLALAGTRSDTARVALTGLAAGLATLAYLAALTVVAIPTVVRDGLSVNPQYRHALIAEAGLRPGVVVVLVLLTVPVLALAARGAVTRPPPGRDPARRRQSGPGDRDRRDRDGPGQRAGHGRRGGRVLR